MNSTPQCTDLNQTAEMYFLKGIEFCINHLNSTLPNPQNDYHKADELVLVVKGMLYTCVFMVYCYEFEWDDALQSAWNIQNPTTLAMARCIGRHFRLFVVIYQCYYRVSFLEMLMNYVELSLFILVGDFVSKVLGSYYAVTIPDKAQKE